MLSEARFHAFIEKETVVVGGTPLISALRASLSLRLAWSTVPGQPGIHREILSQTPAIKELS